MDKNVGFGQRLYGGHICWKSTGRERVGVALRARVRDRPQECRFSRCGRNILLLDYSNLGGVMAGAGGNGTETGGNRDCERRDRHWDSGDRDCDRRDRDLESCFPHWENRFPDLESGNPGLERRELRKGRGYSFGIGRTSLRFGFSQSGTRQPK